MLALLLLNRMNAKRRVRHQRPVEVNRTERKTPEMLYCRTCLNTDDLVSIFYDKENEHKRSHDLRLVTGLHINMDDGLSQKICTRCIETMNMALQFRRTSRKAEKALLNMISGKPKKKYSSRLQKSLKPKVESTKMEKMELNDYSYEIFGDQFQDHDIHDDDDYDVHVEHKPKTMQKTAKKKRMLLPNCASYKCSTCNKEFRMKATYKAHMRFHTNYCVCEACGKRCRNNNQLQEHKRARHGLNRIHKCAYCEYSSATKEALTIHERRHTGERPYVCDHCGATFHRRSNLVQHIAIHLPEKNFQCDMCPKRLKSRKFLQIHKHNAHTGKRYGYLCGICEHRFEKPNKVRAHTRRVHGLADEQQGPIVRVQLAQSAIKARSRENVSKSTCTRSTASTDTGTYVPFVRTRSRGQVMCACISPGRMESRRKTRELSRSTRYICPQCPKTYKCPDHVRRHLVNVHNLPRCQQGPVEKYVVNI